MDEKEEGVGTGTGGGEPEKEPYQELLLSLLAWLPAWGRTLLLYLLTGRAPGRKLPLMQFMSRLPLPTSLPPSVSLLVVHQMHFDNEVYIFFSASSPS